MTKWAPYFAAAALAATPSSAAIVVYELELLTDAPYTAFGGGPSGDLFIGTFGFDDALYGSSGPVFDPVLSENAFYLNIDINGTTFSTGTPGATLDNGLRFEGGGLLDIFFDITNPNGDRLEVRTDYLDTSFWSALDDDASSSAGGETFGESVVFTLIPEPSSAALGGLATLFVFLRRRR